MGDSSHSVHASVHAPAVMGSGGDEELSTLAELARAQWGPTAPFGQPNCHRRVSHQLSFHQPDWCSSRLGRGSYESSTVGSIAVVPLSCGFLIGPVPFHRASSEEETGQEPSLGDAVGGLSRGYALPFGFLHPALRSPAFSRL